MCEPVIGQEELQRLLQAEFPETFNPDTGLTILEIRYGGCRIRQGFHEKSLRPGGTMSGPTMLLADVSVYIAVLASIGWTPLAVTTSLNINFLKKPVPALWEAECRLLKIGKRLVVGRCRFDPSTKTISSAAPPSTYSIPPRS